jgi:hypothetical protein
MKYLVVLETHCEAIEKVVGTDNTMAKRTNNDIQTITQTIHDCATRTHLKTESELMCSGRVSSSLTTRYRILWLSLLAFILIYNRHGEILAHLADPFTNMVVIGYSCFD